MITAKDYAVKDPTSPLAPYSFERREVRIDEVLIEMLNNGIYHTDIHFVKNE